MTQNKPEGSLQNAIRKAHSIETFLIEYERLKYPDISALYSTIEMEAKEILTIITKVNKNDTE